MTRYAFFPFPRYPSAVCAVSDVRGNSSTLALWQSRSQPACPHSTTAELAPTLPLVSPSTKKTSMNALRQARSPRPKTSTNYRSKTTMKTTLEHQRLVHQTWSVKFPTTNTCSTDDPRFNQGDLGIVGFCAETAVYQQAADMVETVPAKKYTWSTKISISPSLDSARALSAWLFTSSYAY